MACACSKNRRQARTVSKPREVTPVTVKFPDGSTRTYTSKLEAYAAKSLAGGGEIQES